MGKGAGGKIYLIKFVPVKDIIYFSNAKAEAVINSKILFMKQFKSILILAIGMTLALGVSGAAMNVPVATTEHEKQASEQLVPEVFHGANISALTIHFVDGFSNTVGMVCQNIYTVDEAYYSFGYKAKLSNATTDLFAPPDNGKQSSVQYKVDRRYLIPNSKRRLCL